MLIAIAMTSNDAIAIAIAMTIAIAIAIALTVSEGDCVSDRTEDAIETDVRRPWNRNSERVGARTRKWPEAL